MRFDNSANWSPISDGPHRIEQTACAPGQVYTILPADNVGLLIVLDAQVLLPPPSSAAPVAEPEAPII